MASLYEIDSRILECVDPETGEIIDTAKLEALQMERLEKIEKVALWYKDLLGDAEKIKAEKNALAEREAAMRTKAASIKNWLTDALNGEKLSTARVDLSFRKSEAVEITDEAAFIHWAQQTGHRELLSFKDPTPNKVSIKAALNAGQKIDGAAMVKKYNIQIK